MPATAALAPASSAAATSARSAIPPASSSGVAGAAAPRARARAARAPAASRARGRPPRPPAGSGRRRPRPRAARASSTEPHWCSHTPGARRRGRPQNVTTTSACGRRLEPVPPRERQQQVHGERLAGQRPRRAQLARDRLRAGHGDRPEPARLRDGRGQLVAADATRPCPPARPAQRPPGVRAARASQPPTSRRPARARRGTPPAGPRCGRPASSASCPPSASPAACACARCRRRSTWRSRPCGTP